MKKILILLTLLLSAQAALAQAVPTLLVPADSRALSMGGVVLPLDMNKQDVQLFYGSWAPKSVGSTLLGGDAIFRVGSRVALSVEGRAFMDKPYDIASAQGQVTGTFRPTDIMAGAGVSFSISDAFAVGVKARMVSSAIAQDAKGSTFCGDVTAAYTGRIVSASVGVRNLGGKLSYGGNAYALPTLAAVQARVEPLAGFTIGAEVDYLFSGALMAGLGLEYTIADIVSIRGGYHYGDEAKALPSFASVGLGVKFAGVHLDAAFLLASKTLGNTLMVGLGYSF